MNWCFERQAGWIRLGKTLTVLGACSRSLDSLISKKALGLGPLPKDAKVREWSHHGKVPLVSCSKEIFGLFFRQLKLEPTSGAFYG